MLLELDEKMLWMSCSVGSAGLLSEGSAVFLASAPRIRKIFFFGGGTLSHLDSAFAFSAALRDDSSQCELRAARFGSGSSPSFLPTTESR